MANHNRQQQNLFLQTMTCGPEIKNPQRLLLLKCTVKHVDVTRNVFTVKIHKCISYLFDRDKASRRAFQNDAPFLTHVHASVDSKEFITNKLIEKWL